MDKIAETEFLNSHQNLEKEHLVFISYDTNDLDLVKAIDGVLQRVFDKKISTFIAKRDIKAGDDAFRKMLHESLAKCTIVLAICTKRSRTSPWLWFESGAGFQKAGLIPVWSGVMPQDFKAPMTIFQGKSIRDKNEINELLQKIAEVTGVGSHDVTITEEEFLELLKISKELDDVFQQAESERIEDKIEFGFPVPNGEEPVQYLIEANFPLAKPLALQKLMGAIENSRFFLQNFQGSKYPLSDGTINDIGHGASTLSKYSAQPYQNQIRQQMLLFHGNLTITHWLRDYFSQTNGPRFIRSKEFVDESAKLFLFFCNLCKQLELPAFEMRIRLLGLENGTLHADGATQKVYQSFKAPTSNEIEVTHTISLDNSESEYIGLLMDVWGKFRTPNGQFPLFNETEFASFLKNIPEI